MDSAMKKRKADENGTLAVIDSPPTRLTPEEVRKIIEPFTQDQLIEILQSAALNHLDVLQSVRLLADRDPAQRKLFIRGLGWDTTTEVLRTLFSEYGELEEAVVILDKVTGKSKGYGFITFKHIDGAMLALKDPSKKIDGRMTVTQLAAAGVTGPTGAVVTGDASARKIYVGNVPFDMPADRLLAHFLSYGEIEEGPLGFDKQTGKSRGFALFVYKTTEAAKASLVDPMKSIDGHQMNCKLAADGKKKPGAAVGGTTAAPEGVTSDGAGMQGMQTMQAPSSIQNPLNSQFTSPGGLGMPGGNSSFAGYASGHQGPAGMGHHMPGSLQTSLGATGLSGAGSQVSSSLVMSGGYGAGLGNPYSGLGGGPASGAYGGAASAYGGLGSASSLYRLPPGSGSLPAGGYPEVGHYGLPSSAFPGQLHQQAASSPAPRVPHGALYPSLPPYY